MSIELNGREIERLYSELPQDEAELRKLISPKELAEEVAADPDVLPGTATPWEKLNEAINPYEGTAKFTLRPGELTIWAGEGGVGKTRLLAHLATTMIGDGKKVVIASLEMQMRELLRIMSAQAAGGDAVAPPDWRRDFCNWADGRLWLYDELDTVSAERIYRMAKVAILKLGAQHVFIDSLMKCGIRQDGDGYLSEQTAFVDRLQHLAKAHDAHIHLVTHMRKPPVGRQQMATKWDIRGAGQISDLADNVVLLTKNQEKIEALEAEVRPDGDWDHAPDLFFEVAKQRHAGWEGTTALMRHRSGQFVRVPQQGEPRAIPWPNAMQMNTWRKH